MAGVTHPNALRAETPLLEYRIKSVLGADGFGITYFAHDAVLQKNVVIQEYLPSDLARRAPDGSVVPVSTDTEPNVRKGLAQFLVETRALARFVLPNIVRVDRCFEANGTAYMLREYEKGESLAQHLGRAPQPAEAELKSLLIPLLDGLEAVHNAGVLHRDIKPGNIFLRDEGAALVLLDFGTARLTSRDALPEMGSILTPGYAPVEQYLRSDRQGPWSDIYSLAGVLYLAVTGEMPPDALSRLRIDEVGRTLNIARVWYSGPFIDAIQWGLTIEEGQRPRSVGEWRVALLREPPPLARALAGQGAPDATRQYVWVSLGAVLCFVFIAGTDLMQQRAEQVRSVAKTAVKPVQGQAREESQRPANNTAAGLSREEVSQNLPHLAGRFSEIDADQSGRVTIEELQGFFKRK